MNTAYGGVVHTLNQRYGNLANLSISTGQLPNLDSEINFLEGKEKALYRKIGVNNYDDFIDRIRSLFNSVAKDREVLTRFSAANLNSKLSRFQRGNTIEVDTPVTIICDPASLEENTDYHSSNKNVEIDMNGNIVLGLNYDVSRFKSCIKELTGVKVKPQSANMKKTTELIDEINKAAPNAIKIVAYKEGGEQDVTDSFTSKWDNFPWGYTVDQINEMLKSDPSSQGREDLTRAWNEVENFIKNTLGAGASATLKMAINRVWEEKMGSGHDADSLMNLGFFSKGRNIMSGIKGALGEFQTALIAEYINLRLQKESGINSAQVAEIIGNIVKGGEQPKTDVQILEKFGVQVKNLNLNAIINGKTNTLINTTIHPNQLAQVLNGGINVSDFLINYYFNLSFQTQRKSDFERLKLILQNRIQEVMNLSISENISDSVCFYMVGAQHLIPASHILQAVKFQQVSVEIGSAYTGYTDEQYNKTVRGGDSTGRAPLFIKYWHGQEGNWTSTEANAAAYNRLNSSAISIKTKFDVQSLTSSGRYSIF